MHLVSTNALDQHTKDALETLRVESYAPEELRAPLWLDNDINVDQTMDCFFLAYDDERAAISDDGRGAASDDEQAATSDTGRAATSDDANAPVAFLCIFMPEPHEAEITAFTKPGFRRRGCFAELLRRACKTCAAHGATSFLFVIENGSHTGAATLQTLGASEFSHSEYQMELPLESQLPLDATAPSEGNVVVGAAEDMTASGATDATADALDSGRLTFAELSDDTIGDYRALTISAFEEKEPNDEYVHAALENPQRHAVLAYLDGEPVGVYHINTEHGPAFIYGVAIRKDLRGCGLGTRLLDHAVQAIRDMGLSAALEVDSQNPVAFHIYTKLGFRVTLQIDYYRAQIATVLDAIGR